MTTWQAIALFFPVLTAGGALLTAWVVKKVWLDAAPPELLGQPTSLAGATSAAERLDLSPQAAKVIYDALDADRPRPRQEVIEALKIAERYLHLSVEVGSPPVSQPRRERSPTER